MGFFRSPMTLIRLSTQRERIVAELEGHASEWYFTKEGEQAYNNAKTKADKVLYFFDYLNAVTGSRGNRDTLYRAAYVMANSMDGSSLDFSGYPNILKTDKNPLVRTATLKPSEPTIFGLLSLSLLHGSDNASDYLEAKAKPYTFLTYSEKDGSMSDLYKIERDIIGAFCLEEDTGCVPPYVYDIIDSEIGPDSDEDEKDEYDED